MSDAEHRVAEALFEPKQDRAEIKDAIKLEEARFYEKSFDCLALVGAGAAVEWIEIAVLLERIEPLPLGHNP
jgi:aspartate carbamoyltransferase regulatory subunit